MATETVVNFNNVTGETEPTERLLPLVSSIAL